MEVTRMLKNRMKNVLSLVRDFAGWNSNAESNGSVLPGEGEVGRSWSPFLTVSRPIVISYYL